MLIRPATVDDARAIAEVVVASWRDAYRGIVDDEVLAQQDVDVRTEQWKAWLGRSETQDERRDPDEAAEAVGTDEPPDPLGRPIVFVADEHGVVAGFVAADGNAGLIAALYVAPARTRAGIGTALLSVIHDALRAAGHSDAHLWVFEANSAGRSFYAAHGYAPDGTTEEVAGQPAMRLATAL